jgi:hypothetical protein
MLGMQKTPVYRNKGGILEERFSSKNDPAMRMLA